MEKIKRKIIMSTLCILIFIFLLAYIAPKVGNGNIQEIVFGMSIIVTLIIYFILIFQCARQTKIIQGQSCYKYTCICIRGVFYGLVVALLLNLPLIVFLLLYLLRSQLLVSIIGTIENLTRFFVIPWGLFLIVVMIQLVVSGIFVAQMIINFIKNWSL